MRGSLCRGNPTCLHGENGRVGYEDGESDAEECDPTGRYIRYKEVLGRGSFKTVYRGFDEIDGIEVAWNQIKLQEILRCSEDLNRLCAEVHLLKTLKHKNIIKFHHSWVDTHTNRINFITELFSSGTLRQYRKRHKHVDLKAVKSWCRQILRGLLYLHSHDPPIIHRDLKCDNIFINGNLGEVKIGDLGLAAILYQTNAAHSIIGTPEFMAPELYQEEYTELVDIYSFGMCLLEMVTAEYPYIECENAAQIYKRVSSGIKPEALKKVKDNELRNFIEKCIDTVSRRLPARELLGDPFLQLDMNTDPSDSQSVLSRNSSNSQGMEDCGANLHKTSTKGDPYLQEFIHTSDIGSLLSSLGLHSDVAENIPADRTANIESTSSNHEIFTQVDLKVQCNGRDDLVVFLSLRISFEGNVRVIHFPFDLDADTAMCVASEMVEELDLADQDVTRIAEMIDEAIIFMIPEWTPGVAIDEWFDVEDISGETSGQLQSSTFSELDIPSNSSPIECHQLSHSWNDSANGYFKDATQTSTCAHGRFEEVLCHSTYTQERINVDPSAVISQFSQNEADVWEHTSSLDSSPVCPASHDLGPVDKGESAFADGHFETVHGSYNLYSGVMDAWALFQSDFGNDPDNELLMHEVKDLTLKFQQDLKELHDRHRQSLLDLRAQWMSKKSITYKGIDSTPLINAIGTCEFVNHQQTDVQDKHKRLQESDLWKLGGKDQ
ncbi:hypothetical protein KP509_10G056900 [Ceratopteris richardii]|uniref:non-specific serine/threonine protein kinase n=2 Tax=Ceratopteris richardii TaxID=49495 RepID=A0A8T2TVK0_CERRI|nr:hypothetical protein KP509_10G056900 [Ceratopteris richardii]